MAEMRCDSCGEVGRWIVGDVTDGRQVVVCEVCAPQAFAPDPAERAEAGVCGLCAEAPADLVVTQTVGGSRIGLCLACFPGFSEVVTGARWAAAEAAERPQEAPDAEEWVADPEGFAEPAAARRKARKSAGREVEGGGRLEEVASPPGPDSEGAPDQVPAPPTVA